MVFGDFQRPVVGPSARFGDVEGGLDEPGAFSNAWVDEAAGTDYTFDPLEAQVRGRSLFVTVAVH